MSLRNTLRKAIADAALAIHPGAAQLREKARIDALANSPAYVAQAMNTIWDEENKKWVSKSSPRGQELLEQAKKA